MWPIQCAYTPPQKGVTEHKSRNLVEISHTLLIHGDVPQCFWGDVVLSACYFTNHMSSLVLENKIPHSFLFPHEPLHPLPLKVSKSTCFVHNICPDLDKFSTRSQKYVLLGFTRSQKGYKLRWLAFSRPMLTRIFFD